jgi:hypothetical protein
VCVRHLVCRSSDGKWTLSDESPLQPAGDPHDSQSLIQLVHLSWNEAGSDLAVVDSSGRVSIYALSVTVNNLALQRSATLDPDDDGSQLVGMMWLNLDRSVETFLLFLCFSLPQTIEANGYFSDRFMLSCRQRNTMVVGHIPPSVVAPLALSIRLESRPCSV